MLLRQASRMEAGSTKQSSLSCCLTPPPTEINRNFPISHAFLFAMPVYPFQQRGRRHLARSADEGGQRTHRPEHLGLSRPTVAALQLSGGPLLPRVPNPALQGLPVQRGRRCGVLPTVARHACVRAHGATPQPERVEVRR